VPGELVTWLKNARVVDRHLERCRGETRRRFPFTAREMCTSRLPAWLNPLT